MNMFFASNLPFEVTEDELKEFFCPQYELIYCKLKKIEYGIKGSYGYLGFKNEKKTIFSIFSYIENNQFKNKNISIELIEDESDNDEDRNAKCDNELDNKEPSNFLHIYKNVCKINENEGCKEVHRSNNIKLSKNVEIINEHGEITKYGLLILKNMNMYDVVILIKKIQQLVRLSPQTAIKMLNENKTIYYSLVHALFLLGILNIEISPLNKEEINKCHFYKIKNLFQYSCLVTDKESEVGEVEKMSDNKININTSSIDRSEKKKKKKRNYKLDETSLMGIYLNEKKRKIVEEHSERGSIEMQNNFDNYEINPEIYYNVPNVKFNNSTNNEESDNVLKNRSMSRVNHPNGIYPNTKFANYYTKNQFTYTNLNKNAKRDSFTHSYNVNEKFINENNNDTPKKKKKNYLNKTYYATNNTFNTDTGATNNALLALDRKKGNRCMYKISKNKNIKNVSFSNYASYNSKETSSNSFKNSNASIDSANEKNSQTLYCYKDKDILQNKFKNKSLSYRIEETLSNKNNLYANNYNDNTTEYFANYNDDNVDDSFRNYDNHHISKGNENEKNDFYQKKNQKVNKRDKSVQLHDNRINHDYNSRNLSECSNDDSNKNRVSHKSVDQKSYVHSLYNIKDTETLNSEVNIYYTNKINNDIAMDNLNTVKNENNNDYINNSLEKSKNNSFYASPQNLHFNDENSNNNNSFNIASYANVKKNDDTNDSDSANDNNDNYDSNDNSNDGYGKNIEYGKKLMQKIKTLNNPRRCIKLIDRKGNETTNEDKHIQVKTINNVNENNESCNKKKKKEKNNNNNMYLKILLDKLKISLHSIPYADDDLLNEIINQKPILQNILKSKYNDMLKWPNEHILRVLSIKKSLKNKGYNINDEI